MSKRVSWETLEEILRKGDMNISLGKVIIKQNKIIEELREENKIIFDALKQISINPHLPIECEYAKEIINKIEDKGGVNG